MTMAGGDLLFLSHEYLGVFVRRPAQRAASRALAVREPAAMQGLAAESPIPRNATYPLAVDGV